jgi:hypothetical protein
MGLETKQYYHKTLPIHHELEAQQLKMELHMDELMTNYLGDFQVSTLEWE